MTMKAAQHMRSAGQKPVTVPHASGGETNGEHAPGIALRGVTKDYGHGRGIFDLSLDVMPGETMGFLGANGAGKTVTMRTLMGFIKPGAGTAAIAGLDCFRDRARIQAQVGYLPGEVTCPEDMRGRDFLAYVADMKRLRHGRAGAHRARIDDLVDRFELDTSARIGQMSKGTKQKVAIVAAFMGNPRVLLLDEPTSGLDPVMQDRFAALVAEERQRGATILLSSHVFAEIERTCDRVAFIRAGHLRGMRSMDEMRAARKHAFDVTFSGIEEAERYRAAHSAPTCTVAVETEAPRIASPALAIEVSASIDAFIKDLAGYRVAGLTSREQTLEDLFRHIYEEHAPDSPANAAATAVSSPSATDSEVAR